MSEQADGELSAGDTRAYSLSLEAKRFVKLSVSAEGGELILTLFGPGGVRLEESRRPAGSSVLEPFIFVTGAAGTYRLELAAPASSAAVRYSVMHESTRAAERYDKNLIEAERDFAQAARRQLDQGGRQAIEEALLLYERALALWREAGDADGMIRALGSIGDARASIGENVLAAESYKQQLGLAHREKDFATEAYVSERLGSLYQEVFGDKANALKYLGDALAFFERNGNKDSEARMLVAVGKVYRELGSTPEEKRQSLTPLSRALEIYRAKGDPYYEGDTLGNLMYAWRSLGKTRQAIFYGKQAVNIFQTLRAGITDLEPETQKTFLKSKEAVYRDLAALLIEQWRLSEAIQVIGMLKEREYADYVRGGDHRDTSKRIALSPDEQREFEDVTGKLTAFATRAKSSSEPGKTEGKTRDGRKQSADRAAEQQTELERFIEELKKTPDNLVDGATALNGLRNWSDVQELLPQMGPGVVALYTLVTKDKYYVILVTPDGPQRFDHEINFQDLGAKVISFREALENKSSKLQVKAKDLYDILVGQDVDKALKDAGATTLLWSFDWVLRYIPVAALHDGDRYMVEKYRNVIFTPDYAWRMGGEKPNVKWDGVGLGVSTSDGTLSVLPGVSDELRGIFNGKTPTADVAAASDGWIMQGRILLDDDFTEDSLKCELAAKRPVVHIASHFVFSPGEEAKSYLLLGKGQRLTLTQIRESLRFNGVELLTLSACNTASGGDGTGKEIEGFADSAQRHSAKAIIATLWAISDERTPKLMLYFYRYHADHPEQSKAEALQQAQLALLHDESRPAAAESAAKGVDKVGGADKGGNNSAERSSTRLKSSEGQGAASKTSYSHPYYWAPFILIGNWR